ncbi:Leucine-rich repeat serine/threonine-protein kinase 2 [Phytophthora boehmeriae]|uniref:Leucine-rich repeat serine/threonine-protein kinase 2 n=1 Tax=Phytophthora boehmeriae TaxID=109152 RepID=A0A8T1X5U3_9STRA|nr:Leucine-rich repeat serine/threonine-protein kinase 2 [Phytophthora boehmeriae]
MTTSRTTDFVVPALGSLLSEALEAAAKQSREMRENELLSLHICDRLERLWAQVYSDQDELRRSLGDMVATFVKFLRKRSELSFLKRLASSRKVDERLLGFHEEIDRIQQQQVQELTQERSETAATASNEWRRQWGEDRQKKLENLQALGENKQVLGAEKGSTDFVEGLFMLKYEIDHKAAQYKTDPIAEESFELMKRTLSKLTRMSNVKLPAIPDWFIPSDDVDFNPEVFFNCGSYGSVHRGTWQKGATSGKGAKVVIKCLLMDDDATKESFYKEVDVWQRLDHPHVVKFYGACHISSPAFFVCDDATHGNFAEYFENDMSQLWRLFYEAALGLSFLHAEKVVHGDLKCTNLLVGSDYKAKLCDFGFAYIRGQSVGLSAKSQTDAIRWKAPECLAPLDVDPNPQFNPRFTSDVFSFGMCIIEAFLGEAPYGIIDDEEIMMRLFEKDPYPRPEGMKDDEWALVKRLIDPEWTTRISLSEAIDKLKQFADREEKVRSSTTADCRVCAVCLAIMPAKFVFCGECGANLLNATEFEEAMHSVMSSCSLCDGGVDPADRFCRHCGCSLDINPALAQ